MKPYEVRYGKFLLSDDKHRIDPLYVYELLCTPRANSQGVPQRRFPTILSNSHCIGAYHGKQQIGFGRVITDYSEFASIWDIYVDDAYRKKGLGKAIMETIMTSPNLRGIYRWFLMTEDAHGLYEKYNFKREAFNPYFMMHVNAEANT